MIIQAFIVALMVYVTAGAASAAEPFKMIWPAKVKIKQGEILELNVSGQNVTAVEGRCGNEPVSFYPGRRGSFTAIIGADLEAKPGVSKISIKATNRAGFQRRAEIIVQILPRTFRQESFKVAEAFDQISPETLESIRIERADFALAFLTTSPERLWELPFIRPVPQESSSSFGYRRIINGARRAPHSGEDLRSPFGTEVLASNHGRVVLMGDYFFAGKSIILDHGGGLHTMYFHLSEFKVDAGARVRRGDLIALSGMSGRVTGPHLHWGARLRNARVDPFDLVNKISNDSLQQTGRGAMVNETER